MLLEVGIVVFRQLAVLSVSFWYKISLFLLKRGLNMFIYASVPILFMKIRELFLASTISYLLSETHERVYNAWHNDREARLFSRQFQGHKPRARESGS
jgi:hypothetical protein